MVAHTAISLTFVIFNLKELERKIFYGLTMVIIEVSVIKRKPLVGLNVLLVLQMISLYLVNKELQSWVMVFVQISLLLLMAEVVTDLRISKIG